MYSCRTLGAEWVSAMLLTWNNCVRMIGLYILHNARSLCKGPFKMILGSVLWRTSLQNMATTHTSHARGSRSISPKTCSRPARVHCGCRVQITELYEEEYLQGTGAKFAPKIHDIRSVSQSTGEQERGNETKKSGSRFCAWLKFLIQKRLEKQDDQHSQHKCLVGLASIVFKRDAQECDGKDVISCTIFDTVCIIARSFWRPLTKSVRASFRQR